MDEVDWDWVGIGSLLLGAVALVLGVARGQIKLGLDGGPTIEQRLARYPASARAVVIKAQRKRALKRMIPVAILGVPLTLAMHFVPTHTAAVWLCEHLGPAEASHWLLRMLFPGLPAVLSVAAALAVGWAVRVLRGGYMPPLDTVVFHDTIAVTGWRAKVHAWLVLALMPLMVVVFFYLTHRLAQSFDTEANRQALSASKCPMSRDAPPR